MTANTGYCLSFQEYPCMLTVTWRSEVSWREAVSLSRLQSVLSSSSILSSFFFLRQFRRHCFFYLVIVKVLFVISFFADVDECTASTPVCGLQFNCNNTLGSYSCEYNHSCCQGMKSIHQLFILMINLFPRDFEKLKKLWSRLKNSHRTKKRAAKYAERRKAKRLHLENKMTAIVVLFPVTCINFHSFALGILDYGKQNNLNPSDGLYTLSTNSTLFQVSAIQQ